MSKIREKSNFNFDAAALLLKNSLYAPSVHCSYYSCFQLLKYLINTSFKISYDEQKKQAIKGRKTTHRYVIDFVINELKQEKYSKRVLFFRREIIELKKLRVKSDYLDEEVDKEKAQNALNLAEKNRRYLINKFQL